MDYVILGAGPAGVIAAESLRRCDPSGRITLVGDEPEPPYSRMAIPYLLAENVPESGTHLRHGQGHYEGLGITLKQDRAVGLSPADHRVQLKGGESLAYDRLLIATGSHTTRPPIPGMDLPGIESCWTLADARRIVAGTKPGARVVLMGAGFIGCIVLEALAARKVELTVVEMADRMLARMMDDVGGEIIKSWCEGKGVKVLTGTAVKAVERQGDALRLDLGAGGSLEADLVVCATGVAPNIDFLDGSGIESEFGIIVDHQLKTSVEDIFAAGDVAQGPDVSTGETAVHAIQPTASEHGRIAALNMAGRASHYRGSLSMNVLNTLGLVSSSFGLWSGVEGGERSVASDPEGSKYLRLEFDGDKLVGALALGLTQHVGVIRGLVQTGVPLGAWKDRLLEDPHQVMHAYLERTKGLAA
ncbi:MAG: FAD-dependent oxidoreductase [Kiloniellales bacterium]|nr:FAD-dependent oxidoreductase [Kiloniellales bacterium]